MTRTTHIIFDRILCGERSPFLPIKRFEVQTLEDLPVPHKVQYVQPINKRNESISVAARGQPSRLVSLGRGSVAEQHSPVIALLLDNAGIPADVEKRLSIGRKIMEHTRRVGVPDENVYIDPLAMALSTKTEGCLIALETMRALRVEYPAVRFSVGLSNVSFGLPLRTIINQAFLAQALAMGLDAAIIDPLDQGLYNMLMATELVLGRDRFCRNYTRAFKAGRLKIEGKS